MSDKNDTFQSLEEFAKKDPVWRKVLEYEQGIPQIMVFSFLNRFSDTRAFIRDLLDILSPNKAELLKRFMHGVPELLSNPKYWKQASVSEEFVQLATDEMEKHMREKIDRYELRIINQGLVNYCTLWDTFLECLLDSVLRNNVKILFGVAEGKNINLKDILELGSVEAVVQKIRAKEVANFAFEDITKRFQYLDTKLGIRTVEVFEWRVQTDEMKEKLKEWNLGTLENIYQKRHSIVHQDDTPITSSAELETIQEFFIQMLFNLALLVKNKHNMWFDMAVLAGRPEIYQTFKKQMSSSEGGS